MKFNQMKEEYVGKKLLTVISLDTQEEYIKTSLKSITNNDYNDIDSAKLLLFENSKALVFVDFDSDGYRSGDWHIIHLEEVLDKGQTKDIKTINSTVRNIEFFKDSSLVEYGDGDDTGVIITTDEYIIKMGQHNVSDYYPSNFFNVEECKQVALGKGVVINFDDVNGRVEE